MERDGSTKASTREATTALLAAMRGKAVTCLILLAMLAGCVPKRSVPLGVEVYFSPKGGCTEAIVTALAAATNTVYVQAYSFTSTPIAAAIAAANRRGLKVQVILDSSQRTDKYSGADYLKNSGIPTYIDDRHAIAHNKVMIVDGAVVITGSFNFTNAAEERNAENLLIIRDPVLAGKYLGNWLAHAVHSVPYQRAQAVSGKG